MNRLKSRQYYAYLFHSDLIFLIPTICSKSKYNTLVVEHETLIEEVKNDLYDKIFERIFRETERLALYEEENKKLRSKIKELKKKLMEKNK